MIQFVVFDFDGVFTDGKCFFTSNKIQKYYNIKDGMALSILRKNNIQYGLISSYQTSKEILINDKSIDKEIVEHLQFNYKYIGKGNKLEILNTWLQELKLSYDNVAYIGDDINDIEVQKKVGFSACPFDAIQECKNIVHYICKKKGGDGCVREFVDTIIKKNSNKKHTILQEIKDEFNYQIQKYNIQEIQNIADIIQKSTGNIYFLGVGKSGNIAKHCSDLLKSISYKVFSFDILNSTHGDFGCIHKNDLIFLFSNSGNTREIIDIIPIFRNKNVTKIIGICSNENSEFRKLCDDVFIIPFNKEISGQIDKIPTNSCMSQLIFSNILVSLLKNNINKEIYKINHLSGNIGNNLKKIKDVLITEFPKIVLEEEVKITKVLIEMTKYKIGCCFFVNESNELLGIITDGDLRRLMISQKILV